MLKEFFNKKSLIFILFFLLLTNLIYAYQLFFSGEELTFFLKKKIESSKSIRLVSFSLDDTISEEILKTNYEIFLEYEGGYSGNYDLSIKYDKNRDGYLHEKFIVFDDQSVLFGTGNFTESGLIKDFNIFIYTEEKEIVKVFLKELNNFKKGKFGINKEQINVNLMGTELGNVKIITGPSEKIYNEILKEIKKAKEFVSVIAYSFTDPYFVEILEKMSSKNVKIRILSDDWNRIYESPLKFMLGVELKYRNDIHAKALIIDEETFIIGSYNLTYRAREKNDEIVLIIKNKGISKAINRKFDLLWKE